MAITDSISPIEDGFLRLGHVAMLMAEENEQRAYEDIMDRFKRAVFAGEFEPPDIFTPRYFGFESRPLRVEPPAFLCAMTYSWVAFFLLEAPLMPVISISV